MSFSSEDPWNDPRRKSIKVGRIVKKIFSEFALAKWGVTDEHIEQFVNAFTAMTSTEDEELKVRSGVNIRRAYNGRNYYEDFGRGGNLWKSCMRESEKTKFFHMYEKNQDICKILVLFKSGKVAGRALLWDFKDKIKKKEFKIMDRIYTARDLDTNKFITWARENGYYHKENQSSSCDNFIAPDKTDGYHLEFVIPVKKMTYNRFPYLDTFMYHDKAKGVISNSATFDKDRLQNQHGLSSNTKADAADEEKLVYTSDKDTVHIGDERYTHKKNTQKRKHNGAIMLKDEAIYCKYEKDYARKGEERESKHFKSLLNDDRAVYSNMREDFLPQELAVYLERRGDYCLEEDTITCVATDEKMLEEDTVFSTYHDGNITTRGTRQIKGDYIHESHLVHSIYENKEMIAGLAEYIMGVGWVSPEKLEEAKENGLPTQADEVTEYEQRMEQLITNA